MVMQGRTTYRLNISRDNYHQGMFSEHMNHRTVPNFHVLIFTLILQVWMHMYKTWRHIKDNQDNYFLVKNY